MTYINFDVLNDLLVKEKNFLSKEPFPWANPQGVLTDEGFKELVTYIPDVSMLRKEFGVPRKYEQKPHDRYRLRYEKNMPLHPSWQTFIEELEGKRYRHFLEELFETKEFGVAMQWQYAERGCSVSPHCDGERKVGSHLFYFNTSDDWDPSWGGQTLVLYNDTKKFGPHSAPRIEDFDYAIPTTTLGNSSLVFARTDNSWHAVRELTAPSGVLRKLFTVNINKKTPLTARIGARVKKVLHI